MDMGFQSCFRNRFTLKILFISMLVNLNVARPLILSAHEGDRVFIPCFNTPGATISRWSINGTVYPATELLAQLNFERALNGLIIRNVTQDTAGEFICFSSTPISTVQLEVREKDLSSETPYEIPEEYQETDLMLRVTEGDTIFIPCTFSHETSNFIIWRIDGSLYPFLELPSYHVHHHGGIIVHNISLNSAGRIYRCYSNNMESNLQEQYTIHLQPAGLRDELLPLSLSSQILKLVSEGVSLNYGTIYDFQFRIAQNGIDSCRLNGNVTFTMNVTNGIESLWHSYPSSMFKVSFSPPRDIFKEENASAEVYGTNSDGNECARLNHKINVKIDGSITLDGGVQEKSQLCVQLPQNIEGLNVIWPRSPHSDLDCVCGVVLPSNDVRFEDCYCLKQNLTDYNVTLNVTDKRLCWTNLTGDMSIKAVFVRDTYTHRPENDIVVRTFLQSIDTGNGTNSKQDLNGNNIILILIISIILCMLL